MGKPEEELAMTRGFGTMIKGNSVSPRVPGVSRVETEYSQNTCSGDNHLKTNNMRARMAPDGSTHNSSNAY